MRAEISPSHPAISQDARHRMLPVLAAALVLIIYLRTMAPSVFTLDSAELTTAAYSLGLVHSPGYPVYLLLAHLFIKLPIAEVGFRVNLFSAVASSVTVAVLITIIKVMTGRHLPAIVAGLSFGLSYYVWTASVVAEVYALQALMLAVMLYAILRWRRNGRAVYLYFLSAVAGLAVANNLGALLWFPGLFLIIRIVPSHSKMDRRTATTAAIWFILAFSLILYLPLRSALRPTFINVGHFDGQGIFHPMDLTRPANLVWYLTGQQFGSLFFAYAPGEYIRECLRFVHQLWAAFLGVGLPLGFWGLAGVWRTDRRTAQGLLLIMLLHMLFFIGYRAPDKDTMFLPVFVVWVIFMGVGLAALLDLITERLKLILFVLPLALVVINSPYADVSNYSVPVELAQARLHSAEQDAVYLARWGAAEALQYQQIIHSYRTDVTVVNLFFVQPENLIKLIDHALGSGRPVYTASQIPGLADHFDLSDVDHGYRVELVGSER